MQKKWLTKMNRNKTLVFLKELIKRVSNSLHFHNKNHLRFRMKIKIIKVKKNLELKMKSLRKKLKKNLMNKNKRKILKMIYWKKFNQFINEVFGQFFPNWKLPQFCRIRIYLSLPNEWSAHWKHVLTWKCLLINSWNQWK